MIPFTCVYIPIWTIKDPRSMASVKLVTDVYIPIWTIKDPKCPSGRGMP